jgi:hypothetical protein
MRAPGTPRDRFRDGVERRFRMTWIGCNPKGSSVPSPPLRESQMQLTGESFEDLGHFLGFSR